MLGLGVWSGSDVDFILLPVDSNIQSKEDQIERWSVLTSRLIDNQQEIQFLSVVLQFVIMNF